MIRDFRHTCIIVKNLDKSLKFYKDILGLKVFKILTVEGKFTEMVFNKKGIKLTYVKLRTKEQSHNKPAIFELHYWHRPKILIKPGYNHISFTVEDLDYEYRRLRSLGVKFISKPIISPDKQTKICFGYDPDRNLIEFVQDLK
jgi:lactoylglutathione lyase